MKMIKLAWRAAIGAVLFLPSICLAQAPKTPVDPFGDPEDGDLLPYSDISNTNTIDRDVFFFSAPEDVVKKAAQDGDSIAQFVLGYKLAENGKKYSEARTWLSMAARTGSVDAQFLLETIQILQKSNQKEFVDVLPALRQLINSSALNNIPLAQFILGETVLDGELGFKKEGKLGYYWCSRAASNGLCLAMGTMAAKDYDQDEWGKSLRWYLKLANKGEVVSKYCAACILVLMTTLDSNKGLGTTQNLLQARAFLNFCKTNGMWRASVATLDFLDMLSSDKPPKILLDPKKKPNNVKILSNIGRMFDPDCDYRCQVWSDPVSGLNHEIFGKRREVSISLFWFIKDWQKNRQSAIQWYRFAAENGCTDSATKLGTYFEQGTGVQIDKSEAKKWYLIAAKAGDDIAQWSLGMLLWKDFEDYVEAYKWLNISLANYQKYGSREAVKIQSLQNLEMKMTRQQVLEAQRRSTAFLEGKPENPDGESGPRQEAALEYKATGTGFFITADGYIITASHVVHDATRVEIMTKTGKMKAKIVRTDPANDIALLKAEGRFSAIPLENSKTVKLGDTVTTIGFPNPELQGFSPKLTKGEIGSLFGIQDDPRHFQISAPIQPGNSGGPLLNASGNAIGTLVSRLSDRVTLKATGMLPQNVNYALKSSYVLAMVEAMPNISEKLPRPRGSTLTTDEIVKDTESAIVMILVY